MNKKVVVDVRDVKKTFRIPLEASTGIKQKMINHIKGRKGYRDFSPLNGISFQIEEGDFFGIVGRNGSGKSTLLKTIAGIYSQTEGSVEVKGALVPFIELGVGFNPDLTGRENVFLNGALLGFSRKEMEAMYDEIVNFAELHNFMEERLKNYSSGMQVRLAFSIAIQAKGDILLLDEVLAVGDAVFQKKCYDYFKKLKKDKKTVILVSHDASALEEYCNKGVLIEDGSIIKAGSINEVITGYRNIINKADEKTINKRAKSGGSYSHEGIGGVDVKKVTVTSADSSVAKYLFTEKDSFIKFEIEYQVNKDIDDPVYELSIYDGVGQRIFASNTIWSHTKTKSIKKDQDVKTTWILPNIFASGDFIISASIGMSGGSVVLDRVEDAGHFQINKKHYSNAHTNIDYSMTVSE